MIFEDVEDIPTLEDLKELVQSYFRADIMALQTLKKFRLSLDKPGDGPRSDEFWKNDPEIFSYENTRVVFANCSRTEKPKVFVRRENKKRKDEKLQFTRMDLSLREADGLCLEAERLLKEMEATADDATIPTLGSIPEHARSMDHKDDGFWNYATWELGGIRCRPVENSAGEVSLVINSKRDDSEYENYVGPVIFLPRAGVRKIFGKIRENLARYYNNTD